MKTKPNAPEQTDKGGTLRRVLDHPFFFGMSADERAMVAMSIEPGDLREVEFKPGEIILREGESADRFYLIENGSVQLEAHESADRNIPIQKLRSGDVLGFSWACPPFTWSLQARALDFTRAITLNGPHLLLTAEMDRLFGYHLMKKIMAIAVLRLRATRKQLVKTTQQLEEVRQSLEQTEARDQSRGHTTTGVLSI